MFGCSGCGCCFWVSRVPTREYLNVGLNFSRFYKFVSVSFLIATWKSRDPDMDLAGFREQCVWLLMMLLGLASSDSRKLKY